MEWVEAKKREVFSVVVGSHLYGTNRPGSDWDVRGVYIDDPLDARASNIKGPGEDEALTEIREFVRLLANGDNQKIEMLFAPDANVALLDKEHFSPIIAIRHTFLSKNWKIKTMGYAKALLSRIRSETKPPVEYSADLAHCVRVMQKLRWYHATKQFSPVLLDSSNLDFVDWVKGLKGKTARLSDYDQAVKFIEQLYSDLKDQADLPPVDWSLVQPALYECLTKFWRTRFGPFPIRNAETATTRPWYDIENSGQRWDD